MTTHVDVLFKGFRTRVRLPAPPLSSPAGTRGFFVCRSRCVHRVYTGPFAGSSAVLRERRFFGVELLSPRRSSSKRSRTRQRATSHHGQRVHWLASGHSVSREALDGTRSLRRTRDLDHNAVLRVLSSGTRRSAEDHGRVHAVDGGVAALPRREGSAAVVVSHEWKNSF